VLLPLFSAIGRARTQAAHCASLGSVAPGASVPKCAGANVDDVDGFGRAGWALGDGRADTLGAADGAGDGAAGGSAWVAIAATGGLGTAPLDGWPDEAPHPLRTSNPLRTSTAAHRVIVRNVRINPAPYSGPGPLATAAPLSRNSDGRMGDTDGGRGR
jgi:hypothetical protein